MVKRYWLPYLEEKLKHNPVAAILGPRQIGKTTLAHTVAEKIPSLYLDLESPEDLLKLDNPSLFLSRHQDKLIILDEIHRKPEIFTLLRSIVDKRRRAGQKGMQFLILGSAGPDLLKQSSESLAGRIAYIEMTGFNILEVPSNNSQKINKLWLRGGFPESYLADSHSLSFEWRGNFINTYLQRDIPQFGFRIPSEKLRRFWTMLAHHQGQVLNTSALATSLEVTHKTIKHYIDIFSELLLITYLKPWHSNVKKRLVKSPRIYIRDSGLLHKLLDIHDEDQLSSHPVSGASWEGFVLENILSILPQNHPVYFYKTISGAEVDLVIQMPKGRIWAVEIKKWLAPKVTQGFYTSCKDIKAHKKYVIYSGFDEFEIQNEVTVLGMTAFLKHLKKSFFSRV